MSPSSFVYPHPELYPSSIVPTLQRLLWLRPAHSYLLLLLLIIFCILIGPGNMPAVISKYLSMEGQPACSPPSTNCAFSLFVCHAAPGWHCHYSKKHIHPLIKQQKEKLAETSGIDFQRVCGDVGSAEFLFFKGYLMGTVPSVGGFCLERRDCELPTLFLFFWLTLLFVIVAICFY